MLPGCFLLLGFGLASAEVDLITNFDVPKAVKIGESVELKCEYALKPGTTLFSIKWWWTSLQSSDNRRGIYQRLGKNKPQSNHEGLVIKGHDTIELVDMDPRDSGIYECEVTLSEMQEDRVKQELIVYTEGTGPLLNVTTVEDGPDDKDILITCEAFDVAPEPELRIIVGSKSVPIDEVQLEEANGLYNLAVNSTLEEIDEDTTITCEMLFKTTNVTHEPYIASFTYDGSGGAALTTTDTDLPEDATERASTADPAHTDGCSPTIGNVLLLYAAAVSVQVFERF